MRIKSIIVVLFIALFTLFASPFEARGEYTHDPINTVDPALLKIDEDNFLGSKLDGETLFTGADGEEFTTWLYAR